VQPYTKTINRQLISSTPKFYLFDVGVAGFLAKRNLETTKGIEAGRAFEHFILMELMAYKGINDLDFDIKFWRTKDGLEVDFVLGNAITAIEVKISNNVSKKDIKGLLTFTEEYKPEKSIVVSLDPAKRTFYTESNHPISILPYQDFLDMLWNNEIYH
jgi:predicted AAA+ superfamily ATPase